MSLFGGILQVFTLMYLMITWFNVRSVQKMKCDELAKVYDPETFRRGMFIVLVMVIMAGVVIVGYSMRPSYIICMSVFPITMTSFLLYTRHKARRCGIYEVKGDEG